MWAISIGIAFLSLAATIGLPVVTELAPQYLLLLSAFFVLRHYEFYVVSKTKSYGFISLYKSSGDQPLAHESSQRRPAGAVNVQMRLRSIDPRPNYRPWGADYPYPVQLVGITGDPQFSCRINQNDAATFEIVSGWPNNGDFYIRGLDTKSGDHPIHIENGENWILKYDIIADNAKSINFSMAIFVDTASRAIIVQRKN